MNERAVTASDRAFLLAVYADSRCEELMSLGWAAQQIAAFAEMQFGFQQRFYEMRYPAADHCILLCEGEEAGQWRVHRGDDEFVLVDISLLARFRGRGIGSARIGELCREAGRRNVGVRLDVRPDNRAYQLYRRLGFEEQSRDITGVRLAWRAARAPAQEPASAVGVGPSVA